MSTITAVERETSGLSATPEVTPSRKRVWRALGPVAAPARAGLRFHPALIVVIGSCAALFREAMHSGLSGDAYYQLATGRWMLAHHAVIRHDVFSYTVFGQPGWSRSGVTRPLLAWLSPTSVP